MPKIRCADVSCVYRNEKGVCTAKKVALSWHSVMTMHDGRQEFNRCHSYKEDKEMSEMKQLFKRVVEVNEIAKALQHKGGDAK